MKLSKNTIEIFKIISYISQYLILPENSNILKALNQSLSFLIEAEVEEIFKKEVVFDINKFVGVLSLYDINNVEIDFDDYSLIIKDDIRESRIILYNKSMINYSNYLNKKTNLGEEVAIFDFSEVFQKELKKISSIFGIDQLELSVEENQIVLNILDTKKSNVSLPTSDSHKIVISDNVKINKSNVKAKFSMENIIKLYATNYQTILYERPDVNFYSLKFISNVPYKIAYTLAGLVE